MKVKVNVCDLATKRKVMLLSHGIKQAAIAKELGVSRQNVYAVLKGLQHSKRVEEHIAKRLGVKTETIFP